MNLCLTSETNDLQLVWRVVIFQCLMLLIIRFPILERHYYFWITPCCEGRVDEIVTFLELKSSPPAPGSCLETVDNERPMIFQESDTSFNCFPISSFRASELHVGSLGGARSSLGWSVKFTGVLSSACAEPTGFMHLEGPKIGSWVVSVQNLLAHVSSWWCLWTVPHKSTVWLVLATAHQAQRRTICL